MGTREEGYLVKVYYDKDADLGHLQNKIRQAEKLGRNMFRTSGTE